MEEYDVIIIGSGYGGAICAMRLSQAGFSVLVLERGERWTLADIEQSDDPTYLSRALELFVTSNNILYRTGNMVGGASLQMDGAHFRIPQKSYEVTDASGRPYWPEPYSAETLQAYFETAETMLQIRQLAWDEIPKAGGLFAKMLDEMGASCERARMNYRDCLQCGFCSQGCVFGKKNDLMKTYIPPAEAAGAVFLSGANVDHIEPVEAGYSVFYRHQDEGKQVTGTRVIVAGGGIHSPAVLLRSAEHLPALSDHVGEHFNNNGEHAFLGIVPPDFDDLDNYYCYMGMENSGMMTFHWYDEEGFTLHPGGGFEPTVLTADIYAPDHPLLPSRSWGMEMKRFVETVYPHRLIGFSSLGLSDGHQAVINRNGATDMAERDRTSHDAYLDRLESIVATFSTETGITLVPSVPRELSGQTSAHLLCTCRMADTVENGVVDADCQVFGYENLYVCDSAVIPYALAVNPALTIAALAERTAEKIIERG